MSDPYRSVSFGSSRFDVVDDQFTWFWDRFETGRWEPETLDVLNRLAVPGAVIVDVGAWIGPTVLAAAARGATVRAYEPDPVAREVLEANIAANHLESSIEVVPVALGATDGCGFLAARVHGAGVSQTSLKRSSSADVAVAVVDARTALAPSVIAVTDLVKIDVEGAEFEFLPLLLAQPWSPDCVALVSVHAYSLAVARVPALATGLTNQRHARAVTRRLAYWVVAPIAVFGAHRRLLRSLRSAFDFVWIAQRNTGQWRPLRRRDLLGLWVRVPNYEVLLANRPDVLGADA